MNRRSFLCSLLGVPAALALKVESNPFVPEPEFPLGTTIATSSGTYTYVQFINRAGLGKLCFDNDIIRTESA